MLFLQEPTSSFLIQGLFVILTRCPQSSHHSACAVCCLLYLSTSSDNVHNDQSWPLIGGWPPGLASDWSMQTQEAGVHPSPGQADGALGADSRHYLMSLQIKVSGNH